MVVQKEKLTDLKEKYEKAYKLVDEESKQDPPTDPFRSHYAAREILTEIMENLRNSIISESENSENEFTYKVILAFVYRDLGRIYVFTEEVSTGEKFLKNCLELIEDHKMDPEAVIPYVGALNELGIVFSNRQNPQESLKYLQQSEEVYHKFKETDKKAMSVTDIFGTREEVEEGKGPLELEKLYTLCTFYLAQVLGHLGELESSASYCNTTLRRQLNANDYEPIDWALNAATLSQYYIGPNRFKPARHHLAAATLILSEYETKMITEGMSDDQKEAAKETFRHRYADIARCWAKYGLALLAASKDRLLADDEDKISKDVKNLTLPEDSYKFQSLALAAYEDRITADYCLTLDDAKLVQTFVTMWLDKAKEYYKAETEASEYAKIIMDYAELYKHLAFFDEIPANQSKMHKKRADHLEDLLKLLNQTYYLAICRECWYECGSAYCAMLDVKLDNLAQLKYDETPTPHQLHKVNTLCDKAIKHFQLFIDSYKAKDSEELQENISDDEMQPILYCYFHIGRLFYKIITHNKQMQLDNLTNSLKYYKTFVEKCESRKEASAALQAEIGVCKEMVSLLPLKIKRVVLEIQQGI